MIESEQLRSIVYLRPAARSSRLVIFLEGDGQPWRAGVVPADDPTTSDALALKLMLRTPGAAAYVTRPCYQGEHTARCMPDLWTHGRYSRQVVHSMRATIEQISARHGASEIVLVGYSGGGVLALLIAERLDRVKAVVTIAANLDIDAWTKHHGYLPLSQSLNPASSHASHDWKEIHLLGASDTVVPHATTDAYFARFAQAQRWRLDEHGHRCCWLENWGALWSKIQSEIDR